jgi:nicotinate-nucleotide adenylyltransferase
VNPASIDPLLILGGTFDPVHFGHLRAAKEVREQLGVKSVSLMPAGNPPHRQNSVSDPQHRLAMLQIGTKGMIGVHIDQRELNRDGPSYMVDTLVEIRGEARERPVILIIGQDSANTLDSWHRWQDILPLAHLVIMTRPAKPVTYSTDLELTLTRHLAEEPACLWSAPAGRVLNVQITEQDISSSQIRAMIRKGESPGPLLPGGVLSYIEMHGLYQTDLHGEDSLPVQG